MERELIFQSCAAKIYDLWYFTVFTTFWTFVYIVFHHRGIDEAQFTYLARYLRFYLQNKWNKSNCFITDTITPISVIFEMMLTSKYDFVVFQFGMFTK